MSRRKLADKRVVLPDPKFNSALVTKFVNMLMYDGKKSIAESIFYGALDLIRDRTGNRDVLAVFNKAVSNTKPILEIRSRRVGGSTYQVPVEVRPNRRTTLSMRWIIDASRTRSERTMKERLAGELLDAAANKGIAIKKREDTHKMAEANKAFAHYRW
ncbi:30S ribosomal protein S7 [Candidatus Vecturithrix granuli]|uniref:Small ribosomal subunit protein uS7 n=1 Tax=Vecturithrix granuli TaxID=1499967 RepID=A0A081C343_VECG1|nr:30S ribosomal protein S7 [Candidatus Vecturithrix granuli]